MDVIRNHTIHKMFQQRNKDTDNTLSYSFKGRKTNSLSASLGCGITSSPSRLSSVARSSEERVSSTCWSYNTRSRSTALGPNRIDGTRPTVNSIFFTRRSRVVGGRFVSTLNEYRQSHIFRKRWKKGIHQTSTIDVGWLIGDVHRCRLIQKRCVHDGDRRC